MPSKRGLVQATSDRETRIHDHGTVSSGTVTPDLSLGYHHYINVTGNMTLANPINVPDDREVTLYINIDGAFLNVITLGTDYDIPAFEEEGFGRSSNVIIHTITSNGTSTKLEQDGIGTYLPVGSVLIASDATLNDKYGSGVALSSDGSILVVGARAWTDTINPGGVYVYDWSVSGWIQRGIVLDAADRGDADNFGDAVALSDDGEILAVGASLWDGTGSNEGGVYIYDRNGTGWTVRGSILEGDTGSSYFGSAVSLSADGEVLAVGAPGKSYGAVYIYDRNGTSWTARGSILESGVIDGDNFGGTVSLSDNGEVLVVGAPNWDGTGVSEGCVYIYDKNGTGWTQRGSRIQASDASASDNFGTAVAISSDGETLVVGADDAVRNGVKGSVYFLDKSGTSWIERGQIVPHIGGTVSTGAFGIAVTISTNADKLVIADFSYIDVTDQIGGVYTYKEIS